MPYVWYACYGSNLYRKRFMCYIQGGKCEAMQKTQKGCRDKTPPLDDQPYTLQYQLYFAQYSSNWDGGVAFILQNRTIGHQTYGRIYKISEEQFLDVVSQENGNKPFKLDLSEVIARGSIVIDTDWRYGRIIYLGEEQGDPVFTFTAPNDTDYSYRTRPSQKYIDTIVKGLIQIHGMSEQAALEYLIQLEAL